MLFIPNRIIFLSCHCRRSCRSYSHSPQVLEAFLVCFAFDLDIQQRNNCRAWGHYTCRFLQGGIIERCSGGGFAACLPRRPVRLL